MLVGHLVSNPINHRVHLVLNLQLFLFESNFVEMVLLRHVMAAVQLLEFYLEVAVFLGQKTKLRARGHQV